MKKDPYENRLKSINEDSKVQGGLPSWVIRHCGDKSDFYNTQGQLVNYSVVVVKSLWWPGAFNFYS